MANVKVAYGTTQNFTITLASLASSATAGRESSNVSNTSDLFVDVQVQIKITLQTGTPANDKAVYIYAYGSLDDGTTYTDNATGSDAAITLRVPSAIVPIGVIPCPDSGGLSYESQPMTIAAAFGGYVPSRWGIVVRNYTGVTFNATEGQHTYKYRGVYLTSA